MTTPTTLSELINQACTNTDNEAISQLQSAVMAFGYWLYKADDCRYGDSHDGLAQWAREGFAEYNELCVRSDE